MDGKLKLDDVAHTEGCGPLLSDPLSLSKPLRQRVFEHVRAQGSVARKEISHALEISPGSATTLTADLIRMGLLREVADNERDHARGRPRVALEIVPEAGLVIGIKLGDEVHTAALSDFAGRIVVECRIDAGRSKRSLDDLLDEVDVLIAKLLDAADLSKARVQGVGIGMAGIVDHESGLVHWSPLIREDDQAFGDAFEERFGLPVVLENDANMLTLAELWFGAGRAMMDFAVVTIEKGVGMGLVLDNQLYRGSFGMGLELGHTKVQMDGALCRCGQRGCLEAYISDYALLREAGIALHGTTDDSAMAPPMMESLFQEAGRGNEAARKIFQRAGRFLALGLSNVVQLFDPALIILSGERKTYDFMYADNVRNEVQALTLSRNKSPCQIEVHDRDDLDWARGATARALAEVTDRLFCTDANL